MLIAVSVVIVLALAVFVFLKLGLQPQGSRTVWPVQSRRVLTVPEQKLYWRLVQSFPQHVVLSQVALSQLIEVRRGAEQRRAVFNRFSQLVADFVVCTKDFQPLAVVELDGRSHDHPRQQAADARKSAALEAAAVRLVRLNAADVPDSAALVARVLGDGLARTSPGAPTQPPTATAAGAALPARGQRVTTGASATRRPS